MELNYKQFGQGHPLIILHGLFGMLDNWQTVAKALAEDYMVFIIDQRNHGKSPHLPEMNYELMAEDLRQFMEEHWIHEAYIMGHSMGGKTAMQFALEYPSMVEKLIVVDIAPQRYEGNHQTIFEALADLPLDTLENRTAAEEQLAQRIPQKGVRQFLLKNLRRKKEGGYAFKMNLPTIRKHYADILSGLEGTPSDVETLFIKGGKSNYITPESESLIHEMFPTATIATIADAGHWVHAEQPQALMQRLRGFLG